MMTQRTKKGFTLVEILIVVIILGILAAIIIPQFTDASQDARKSSAKSNMQAMRSQFELYRAQHLDIYPWDDGDGELDTNDNIKAKLTTKTLADGTSDNTNGKLGPYMQSIPQNPFAKVDKLFGVVGDTLGTCHWMIDLATGAISDGTGEVEPAAEEGTATVD